MSTSTVDCRNPRVCRGVKVHRLGTGASAKCGATAPLSSASRVRQAMSVTIPSAAASVGLRDTSRGSLLTAEESGRNIIKKAPKVMNAQEWSDLRSDLVDVQTDKMVEAADPNRSANDRTTANYVARGLGLAIQIMDETDECDTISLNRQLSAEIQTVHHVPEKLAGLLIASRMVTD